MKIDLVNQENSTVRSIDISDSVFKAEINDGLIHELVTSYRSNGRSATKGQKNRSRVSGGGAKPWRQKGTGRARAGTTRGPLWVGGGMAFATVERNYSKKINKKAYKRAMQSIFSALIEEKRIIAIESIKIDSPKTKLGLQVLSSLELRNALFIVSELDSNLNLSLRNIPHIKAISVENVDPISLLGHEKIVIDQDALNKLEGMFS
ncbi:MAG: 50S ribosomal protein L4 [Gammaproteobacteria bacterium]|jgi:large subunit ribosomal protein L4|nr:50S ribosomal protein L4 [Gammaproteobacteria bacterium]HJL79908.1 50S ribosomal protein L4 [Gammaproteobacteria bacterium]HJN00576.1 50S ribosomal protein L4 [Gammaproteobacteria bacterium]|tara:strand:- start:4595 stop:5212 length:618 start_codon:yes stop_codon:yes gene_type:complete